jgi:hypothetical protein
MVGAVIWLTAVVLLLLAWRRIRRARRRGIGSAAAGSIYDFLNQEKRNAIEIIIEERAGARDPEDRDGNLPDLEKPRP